MTIQEKAEYYLQQTDYQTEDYAARDLITEMLETINRCEKVMCEDLHVERLLYENGKLNLNATHPLGKAIIASLVSVYVSSGAENYFEMNCYHPKVGPLAVTIQRENGKSPGQIAGELREELRQLKEPC